MSKYLLKGKCKWELKWYSLILYFNLYNVGNDLNVFELKLKQTTFLSSGISLIQ